MVAFTITVGSNICLYTITIHLTLYNVTVLYQQLEALPTKDRTMSINMALGDLYREEGMDRSAITSYKEVLRYVKRLDLMLFNRYCRQQS